MRSGLLRALTPAARDAVKRFVRILLRCGFSQKAILDGVTEAFEEQPRNMAPLPPGTARDLPEAAHLLTLWKEEPAFLDAKGRPRRLRRRGRAPSFETLARRVSASWDVDEVLEYLLKTRGIRRRGSYYYPNRRAVVLVGIHGPATFRNVRGLGAMLKTNEHNLTTRHRSRAWFERNCENPKFPVSQLPKFAVFMEREGMASLERLDTFMRSCELNRKAGEPTIALGVGIYRYQEDDDGER